MKTAPKNRLFVIGTGIVLCLIVVLTIRSGMRAVQARRGDTAVRVTVSEVQSGSSDAQVLAEGNIVPAQVTQVMHLPSFQAQVIKVNVTNGTYVTRGQVLAELDPIDGQDAFNSAGLAVQSAQAGYDLTLTPHRPEELRQAEEAVRSADARYRIALSPHRPEERNQLKLKIEGDRKAVAQAEARLTVLKSGDRPQEIAGGEESVASAKARYDLTVANWERDSALFQRELIPRAALQQSETEREIARSAWERARLALSLQREGARREEISIAEADRDRASLTLQSDQEAYTLMQSGSRPEEIIQAKSTLKQAELALALLRQGSRTEQKRQAAIGLEQAQLEKSRQTRLFGRRFIRAPVSGVIIARNVNPGEVVAPAAARTNGMAPLSGMGRSLFVIAEAKTVEFLASVDQRFLQRIKVGQTVEVSLEAFPGRTFSGKVSRLNPLISPDTSNQAAAPLTFSVWVRLPNPQRLLIPGQVGMISIQSPQNGLIVPYPAVESINVGEGLVYVVKNRVVHSRRIRFDATIGDGMRVREGLEAGEWVITSDRSKLKDGMRVSVVDASGRVRQSEDERDSEED